MSKRTKEQVLSELEKSLTGNGWFKFGRWANDGKQDYLRIDVLSWVHEEDDGHIQESSKCSEGADEEI